MSRIIDDHLFGTREIRSLIIRDNIYTIDSPKISSIIPYFEDDDTVSYELWKSGHLVSRVNGQHVIEIVYMEEDYDIPF